MSERKSVRLRIEGSVQGVGFRDWTRREAEARGLDGWVRNRTDGSVEAVIAGPAEAVENMLTACRQGPPSARVRRVDAAPGEEANPGFAIAPTV